MNKTYSISILILCLFNTVTQSQQVAESAVYTNLGSYGPLTSVFPYQTYESYEKKQFLRQKSILNRLETRYNRIEKEFRKSAKSHKKSLRLIISKLKEDTAAVKKLEKKLLELLEKCPSSFLRDGNKLQSNSSDNIIRNLRNIIKHLDDYNMDSVEENQDLLYFHAARAADWNDDKEGMTMDHVIFPNMSDYSFLWEPLPHPSESFHESYSASSSIEYEIDGLTKKLRNDIISQREEIKKKSKMYATEIKRLRRKITKMIRKIIQAHKDNVKSEERLDGYLIGGIHGTTVVSVRIDSNKTYYYMLRNGKWSQCMAKVKIPELRFKRPKCLKSEISLSDKPLCVFNYIIRSNKDEQYLCLLLTSFLQPNSNVNRREFCTSVDDKIAECGSRTTIRFYYFPSKNVPHGEKVECSDDDYSCKMKVVALITANTTVIIGGGMAIEARDKGKS